MKTSIERAIERTEFEISISPQQFAAMNADNQNLFVESLSEKEKWQLFRHFKLTPNGKLEWSDSYDNQNSQESGS